MKDAPLPLRCLQQVDLDPRPIIIEEHRQIAQWCPKCQRVHDAGLPAELVQAGLIGPQLTALAGFLKGACPMSFSSIRKFFRDVDETDHKDRGKSLWTWCFRATLFTLFKISSSRGSDVLLEVPGTREAENIAERFRVNTEGFFQFITTPGVEPTNNLAEQAIRFVAIHRKITQGTRGAAGQTWCERIWTAIGTCAQTGRSVFEFLHSAITAYFTGGAAPTLIPDTT